MDNNKEKKGSKPDYKKVKSSFYFNHIWMSVTVVITIITAFILENPLHKYIILLETAISTISSTIYYLLTNTIQKSQNESIDIDWKKITILRYNGWVFSTPLMLIAFLLFLSATTKIKVTIPTIITIILLDWAMLLFGYLGEINYIDRMSALVTGFIPFFIMFGIIYNTFLQNKYVFFNYLIFALFLIFWGLYGVGYVLELEPRNYLMNLLDLLSKSGIGILFSIYFLSQ
uniref:Bacteriorhodopsin-like protein n=1 Tax=viral metagenome TaxID=1070528 RepID=A0A6C0I042_9ZZZZ